MRLRNFGFLSSSLPFVAALALAPNIRPPCQDSNGQNGVATVCNVKSAVENWKIVISPADFPKDVERIRVCRIQAFVDEVGNEPEKLLRAQMKFLNAEGAITGRSTCIIAKERWPSSRVLGTVDIQNRKDGSVLLQNVFVSPAARGQGLATRLVKEAERLAAERSDTIVLSVGTNNRPAVNLYQKCSYEITGVHALIQVVSRITGVNLQMEMKKYLF